MLHSKTLEIFRLRARIAEPQRAEAGDQASIRSPVIKASGASCVDDEIMRTGLVYHPAYLEHDMGAGHPESPNRLRAIMQQLEQSGTAARVTRIEPRKAEDEWITQIHSPGYVAALNRHAPTSGRVALDPDTSMSPGSLPAAYLAAGGALAGVDAIMQGQVEHVFCAVRPPGHHAEADRAMGFCLFNNVAIAARYLQNKYGLRRVLVVDWDVHHGNGTQHSFEQDPSILFFSTHQYPHYPGTGRASEHGTGAGEGFTINVPMEAGEGDDEYRATFLQALLPAAEEFKPDFVMISAGFDAHRDDPLAGMGLTEAGYADLTGLVAGVAKRHAQGRILSCLEGGYNLTALAVSVDAHLKALLAA
jgi:acetoin utilization deacetylase AcuC-like enzyme